MWPPGVVVLHPPPAPVHVDLHAPFLESPGPFFAGKLAALIGVEDLGHAAFAGLCTLQRQQAQAGVHVLLTAQPSTQRVF